MGARGFVQEYFIGPLYHDTFNPVNTLVYAGLFLILILITLRIFGKLNLKFDMGFYSYFILYIVLGGLMGALKDNRLLASPLFSTVGIYGLIFILLVGSILAGKIAEKALGVPYSTVPLAAAVAGLGLLLINYAPAGGSVTPLLYILGLGILPSMGIVIGIRKVGLSILDKKVNFGILLAHMLDASSTYMGVSYYGFQEKFFLTGYVMQAFTPASIFLLKAGAVLGVLYILEKSEEDMMEDAIKAAIVTLGLAPAVRNTFLSVFQ